MTLDLNARLPLIAERISENGLLDLVELIWSSDRFFTFPQFQKTARNVSTRLRDWGIKARTFNLPADGKTLYGDWRMPLGWDCSAARLEIHTPFEDRGTVLGDYAQRPTSVIMWSGPTPPGGLIAPVVRIADEKDLDAKRGEIRGKIVYTPAHPKAFKRKLAEAGAAAVVSSWCRTAHHIPDATFWFNAWSDDPGGWAFHAGDAPLVGMAIPPQAGVELDVRLERGPVELKIVVESRYFETEMPIVCGYLDAPLQEEVYAIGHAMEQGANDNASGCAVILESLRVLKEGCDSGALPPLRRAVRGLLVNECYGTIGFAATNPGIMRRMLAGVNWDTCGRHQEDVDAHFRVHRCPDSRPSIADTLLDLLIETWLLKQMPYARITRDKPWALTDNVYADPALGSDCAYMLSTDRYWHTSKDVPETLRPRTLHAIATVSATYLHTLATCTSPEAQYLARETVRRYGRKIEDCAGRYAVELLALGAEAERAALLAHAFDHLLYLRDVADAAVLSAKRFMLREERAAGHKELLKLNRHTRRLVELQKRRLQELAGCAPAAQEADERLKEFAGLRPVRTFIGTPTYDSVPRPARSSVPSPVWDSHLHSALFWCDGKRTFAEVVRRANFESGADGATRLLLHFKFMAEHGLIRWAEPGAPA
ncbi:MAG: hypothetical protein AMXMBFR7_30530 [Planctomycetota bacterium]